MVLEKMIKLLNNFNDIFYLFFILLRISNSQSVNKIQNCSIRHNFNECLECSLVYAQQNLIVGGIAATKHSWPSIAYMKFNYKTDLILGDTNKTISISTACAATLIDKRILLTAGHCIITNRKYYYQGVFYDYKIIPNKYYPTVGSMYSVWLGLHDKSTIFNQNIWPTVKPTVSYVIRHENYDDNTVLNDIALIILKEDISLNEYIQPACLPSVETENYPTVGSSVYAVGWGTTSSGGKTPDLLQNVKLTTYDHKSCSFSLSSNQICAGELSGGKDTCQGDSGGPLYAVDTLNSQTKFVLAGITSFGIGCALTNTPGAYTRVSSFISWIYKNSNISSQIYVVRNSSVIIRSNFIFLIFYIFYFFIF